MSDLSDLLSLDVDQVETIPSTGKPVPNVFPAITNQPYRIAIIGDCPSQDDEKLGLPFTGVTGKFLNALLAKHNILRDACFVGNVCQIRPPGGDITKFERDGEEIQRGLYNLYQDIAKFKPNICLLLGKLPLWAFHPNSNAQLDSWRGSLFVDSHNIKCLATHHPTSCLRQYDWTPLLTFDIGKAKQEATSPILILNERYLETKLTVDETVSKLEELLVSKPLIALDIEGYVDAMSCLSIARSATECFIVPFSTRDGRNYYSNGDDEKRVWRALIAVLADPKIPKVLQNSLYDRFVLQYSYNVIIRGVVDDTMLKHFELYCELEKSLGFQCSLYTKQPYYKSDRKSDDRDVFWKYCCMDSAVTHEISVKLDAWLKGAELAHYRFNIDLLNPILYMQQKGIRYDVQQADTRRKEVLNKIYETQYLLDQASGFGVTTTNPTELATLVKSELCYKRDLDRPKKDNEEAYAELMSIVGVCLADGRTPTHSELGNFSTALGLSLNVRSPKWKNHLYTTLKLPVQTKKDPKTKLMRPSTDFEALLKLKKISQNPVIDYGISLSMHRTRAQMLSLQPTDAGRMHCSYNLVGTETGRISSSRSNISVRTRRVGTNMQTVSDDWEIENEELVLLTEGLRSLYQADEGKYIAQCDLRGADGWTVGCEMAALGDPTMLEDLKAGLKPAQIVCYILRHGGQNLMSKSRAEIKELLKEVKKEDWDYYVCKQVIWGTCYLMGPRKVADQVLKESYGKFALSEKEARAFQAAVFVRYRVHLWHDAMKRHLAKQPYPPKLQSCSGMTRKFFGRQSDILGQALAHQPQVNTTYATNLAAHRLWTDPTNRIIHNGKTTLRVEPLHQVHDALLMQFKIEDTEWAITKIKQWFDNEIVIAGIKLKIPFEGNFGTNWALDKQSKVGDI